METPSSRKSPIRTTDPGRRKGLEPLGEIDPLRRFGKNIGAYVSGMGAELEFSAPSELRSFLQGLFDSEIISIPEPDRRSRLGQPHNRATSPSPEDASDIPVRENSDRRRKPRKIFRPINPNAFKEYPEVLEELLDELEMQQELGAERAQELVKKQGKEGAGFRRMTREKIRATVMAGEYFFLNSEIGSMSFYLKKIGTLPGPLTLKKKNGHDFEVVTEIPMYKIGGWALRLNEGHGLKELLREFGATFKLSKLVLEGTPLEEALGGIVVGRTFDNMIRILSAWCGYLGLTPEEFQRQLPDVYHLYMENPAEGIIKEDDKKGFAVLCPGEFELMSMSDLAKGKGQEELEAMRAAALSMLEESDKLSRSLGPVQTSIFSVTDVNPETH